MARSLKAEVRALLEVMAEQHGCPYEPNVDCENPVCQVLGRLKNAVEAGEPVSTNGNGHH